MKRPNKSRMTERGNAFFVVLIGVVLFTALMFTFSRGAQQGGTSISTRRADLAASEILQFAGQYDRVINRLLSRNCSESDINFDNGVIPNYDNGGAPADRHCDVFRPEGGGLSFDLIPPQWLDSRYESMTGYGRPIFGGDSQIIGVGTDGNTNQELVLWIGFIHQSVCESINQKLKLAATPNFVDGPYAGLHYRGTFANTWETELSDTGLMSACVREGDNNNAFVADDNTDTANQPIAESYHFYRVLMAR